MGANVKDQISIIDITGETGRQTFIAAGTPELYQGHPTTVLTRTGKLLCVWTTGHGGPCGPAAESLDGGRTWTRIDCRFPAVYAETQANCPTDANVCSSFQRSNLSATRRLASAPLASCGQTTTA